SSTPSCWRDTVTLADGSLPRQARRRRRRRRTRTSRRRSWTRWARARAPSTSSSGRAIPANRPPGARPLASGPILAFVSFHLSVLVLDCLSMLMPPRREPHRNVKHLDVFQEFLKAREPGAKAALPPVPPARGSAKRQRREAALAGAHSTRTSVFERP